MKSWTQPFPTLTFNLQNIQPGMALYTFAGPNSLMARMVGPPPFSPVQLEQLKQDKSKGSRRRYRSCLAEFRWRSLACKVVALSQMGLIPGLYLPAPTVNPPSAPTATLTIAAPPKSATAPATSLPDSPKPAAPSSSKARIPGKKGKKFRPLQEHLNNQEALDYETPSQAAKREAADCLEQETVLEQGQGAALKKEAALLVIKPAGSSSSANDGRGGQSKEQGSSGRAKKDDKCRSKDEWYLSWPGPVVSAQRSNCLSYFIDHFLAHYWCTR
jgi:hypothetical protein